MTLRMWSDLIAGQLLGKMWMTLLAVPLIMVARGGRPRPIETETEEYWR